MKDCQSCGSRPATVHFTQVVNGEKSELHVCEVCAAERGDFNLGELVPGGLNIHNLLAGLVNMEVLAHPGKTRKEQSCPGCGMEYRRFAEGGRLGCAQCYSTFEKQIRPLLKRIHGNFSHQGKVPSRGAAEISRRRKLTKLKEELRSAVENEQYERAAELRDQLRSLDIKEQRGVEE